MALTKFWTRRALEAVGYTAWSGAHTRLLLHASSSFPSAVLLRTRAWVTMAVYYDGSSPPPPAQWTSSVWAQANAYWLIDDIPIAMDESDETEANLGSISLAPVMHAPLGASNSYYVQFAGPVLDTPVMRNVGVSGLSPGVQLSMKVTDTSGVLAAGSPGVQTIVSARLDVVWGRA